MVDAKVWNSMSLNQRSRNFYSKNRLTRIYHKSSATHTHLRSNKGLDLLRDLGVYEHAVALDSMPKLLDLAQATNARDEVGEKAGQIRNVKNGLINATRP